MSVIYRVRVLGEDFSSYDGKQKEISIEHFTKLETALKYAEKQYQKLCKDSRTFTFTNIFPFRINFGRKNQVLDPHNNHKVKEEFCDNDEIIIESFRLNVD